VSDDGEEIFWANNKNIKRKAFHPAIKIILPVHFEYNREEQVGSCCQPRLRLRKPQATSAARVKGFRKGDVAIETTIPSQFLCG
jgi:hypothetical protein